MSHASLLTGRDSRSRAGFTLIELLTVITIIAILAAIIVPVAGNIRIRAHQTTSMNNLRQWAAGLSGSLAEFDNSLPSDGGSGTANISDTDAWFNRLPRFMGMKALSDPETQSKLPRPGDKSIWVNPAVKPADVRGSGFTFFYAMNDYLSNSAEPTIKMTRIERMAATVFMTEVSGDSPSVTPRTVKAYFGGGDPSSGLDNEANILFCDGHVISMKRKDFQDPKALRAEPIDPGFTFIPFPEATPQ